MRLKLATYNVRNLFLAREGEAPAMYPKPLREVRPLARMIDQIGADLLMLQEVGSYEALTVLNERLASPYPHVVCLPGNSTRSIHLGALSRLPLTAASHKDMPLVGASGSPILGYADEAASVRGALVPLGLQRDVLRLECDALTAFVVHLKSQGNPPWQVAPAHEVRFAEAQLTARLVAAYIAEHPTRPVRLGTGLEPCGSIEPTNRWIACPGHPPMFWRI